MKYIGFIGLGAMGGRIALRLHQAGNQMMVYNRTKAHAQPLIDAGLTWGESPRAVAEQSSVVFTMVANDYALRSIHDGPDGLLAGLSADSIYIDMSTIHPDSTRALAQKVAETGAHMLEAPVSGGPITVEQGQLSIMVGGDFATFERVKPLLLAIGPRITYIGASGQASMMKIALNLSIPVQVLAFCESILLAEKNGIPREVALDVMLNSALASPMPKFRGPLISDPGEVMFNVTMQQKDLMIAMQIGQQSNVFLPSAAITNQVLTMAIAQGWGQEDFIVIYKVLERLSGQS